MNKILITMGDPAGIGAEIILKFLNDYEKEKNTNYFPIVIGSKSILEYYIDKFGNDLQIKEKFDEIKKEQGVIYLYNIDADLGKLEFGKPTAYSGELSIKYLEKALELLESGGGDAITTAPISKDAINLAGYKYSGHTTFFADKTNTNDYAMILKGNKITVILNTTHLSIIDAVGYVKKDRIVEKIKLAEKAQKMLGLDGKIAVAGLNPHNGENGLFGREEIDEIEPAVEYAQSIGINCEGPIVPDTLFVKMLQDRYSIAVVMYHDQGLIPMKLESFGQGVNITIGLPIIRTSVDHGTAYEIVGENIANHGSMQEAIRCANLIIENSKKINDVNLK